MRDFLTINDIARLTGLSRRTMLRWFEKEPGVLLILDNPERMHKRRYRTFRIPRDVFERVIASKLQKPASPTGPVFPSPTLHNDAQWS